PRAAAVAAFFASLLMMLAGCHHDSFKRLRVVYVLDATASVADDARIASLEKVPDLLTRMIRGDSLSVLSITSDAQVEGPKHTRRYGISLLRAAFDADRAALVEKAKADIQEMVRSVATEKYQHSDLMGTVELGVEEFRN